MSIPLEVVLDRAGRTPYRLTPNQDSLRWTTAAIGGFGSCTFTLPGPPPFWKREIPHLGMLRIVLDTFVIWEGRVEDITLSMKDETTSVTCFGLQRLLDNFTVRRVWSMRDMSWVSSSVPVGTAAGGRTRTTGVDIATGNFDPSDLTKSGVQAAGTGVSVANNSGNWAEFRPPSGVTFLTWNAWLDATGTHAGATSWNGTLLAFQSGAWAEINVFTSAGTGQALSQALSSASAIAVGAINRSGGAVTLAADDRMKFYKMRLWGTSLSEDLGTDPYGFYGGTILNDLITLVPGLTQGVIESGSDYAIPAIERSVRDTARSVVEEVASYYTREWRVWEDGRFDWKSVNADEPQWTATLDDLDSGSELTATVDGLAKTLYVLYTDAASGLDAEASSTSSDQRNPFVKQGQSSDVIVSPGFQMTSSSASQLAGKLVVDQGRYPLVQGRLVIPANKTIRRATGSPLPAFMIRGGDNIVVSDLPKTDLFSQGRDGETLFHIVSTETSLEEGSTTLEIEGQTRRSDVLLARLAAATRGVTG